MFSIYAHRNQHRAVQKVWAYAKDGRIAWGAINASPQFSKKAPSYGPTTAQKKIADGYQYIGTLQTEDDLRRLHRLRAEIATGKVGTVDREVLDIFNAIQALRGQGPFAQKPVAPMPAPSAVPAPVKEAVLEVKAEVRPSTNKAIFW